MTNKLIDLRKTVDESGLKQVFIANKLGVRANTVCTHIFNEDLKGMWQSNYERFFNERGITIYYK